LAWHLYADYWKKAGNPDEARLWNARAEEGETGRFLPVGKFAISADRAILVYPAAVLAGILFIAILYARYRAQRRLDAAARQRAGRLTRGFTWFNLVYWDRRDRVRFLTIVLAVWYAGGVSGILVAGLLRYVSMPIGFVMGSLAGPVSTYYIEKRLPETPERNLLLAVAYQQSGENEKAERLYRALPQFAESWNNLGVLLDNSGRHQEAGQAFQQALKLDPKLTEAALNLGQGAKDFWSEQHQKYLPGRPMIALPHQERWVKAVLGCSMREVYLRAWYVGFSGFANLGEMM
jgi:tetratricopeptide (TPR) repeat protein